MLTDVVWKQSFLWCRREHFSWGNKGKRTNMKQKSPTCQRTGRLRVQVSNGDSPFQCLKHQFEIPKWSLQQYPGPPRHSNKPLTGKQREQELGLKTPRHSALLKAPRKETVLKWERSSSNIGSKLLKPRFLKQTTKRSPTVLLSWWRPSWSSHI